MSQPIRICVVSDAPSIDWGLFSWMKPLAEQGISFTVLARKLPKLPWFEAQQVTAVSAETIEQLANLPQLNGRSWYIFYFTSVSAALIFTQHRTINGRLIIRATNWDLTVAPHLSDGKQFQQQMIAILAQAHRIEVATHALQNTAVAFGVNPQKITFIPLGVNLDYYKPPERQLSISSTSPLRLLSVISLEWADGVEYLLHTIRCCLDAGLPVTADVIGYGSGRHRLYFLLDEFQLFESVIHIHHLPRPALRDKYRQAHFLLQPNLTDEVKQQTIEAMACGLPPLAFRGVNWEELLPESCHVLLTRPRQPQAMADRLRHFVNRPLAYQTLRQQVRQLTTIQFGLDRQVALFSAMFTAVIPEPPSIIEQTTRSLVRGTPAVQRFWPQLPESE
ncbi:MAG: glycosyltransferase family 4 protein [Chloroflexi bacterium]|nr:glycosyltransferase family 4 protein [Chloroflexota bacterium]